MRPQRILVTNDDGASASGLTTLVSAACGEEREVLVAVPAGDVSSTGTALGPVWRTAVQGSRTGNRWFPAVTAMYELTTYPSTIVTLAAMGAFGPPPELVLVGVNHGANVGRGLLHSSTVGAALTAAVHGVPAVAVSVAGAAVDWGGWEPYLTQLVAALPEEWPAGGALNVNLPERPSTEPAEATWCRVADADAVAILTVTGSVGARFGLQLSAGPLAELPPADTDVGALARGRVALTWLTLPYTGRPDPEWPAEVMRRLSGEDKSTDLTVPNGSR